MPQIAIEEDDPLIEWHRPARPGDHRRSVAVTDAELAELDRLREAWTAAESAYQARLREIIRPVRG